MGNSYGALGFGILGAFLWGPNEKNMREQPCLDRRTSAI